MTNHTISMCNKLPLMLYNIANFAQTRDTTSFSANFQLEDIPLAFSNPWVLLLLLQL